MTTTAATTTATAPATAAVAYCRVSTAEQGDSGLGLEAQQARLEAEAAHRGWGRLGLVVEIASAKSLTGRPLLREVLDRLDRGEGQVLLVSRLDRLCRNALDLLRIAERAERHGWSLMILDLNLDTSTPAGRMFLTVMAATAQLERDLISQRTREALAAKRARGERLGRPSALPAQTLSLVASLRAEQLSLREIASRLQQAGVLTATGGTTWHASTVRQALTTCELEGIAA